MRLVNTAAANLGSIIDAITVDAQQIAATVFLAEGTVKNYVSRLLAKLGMERRTQAAVFSSKLGQQHRDR